MSDAGQESPLEPQYATGWLAGYAVRTFHRGEREEAALLVKIAQLVEQQAKRCARFDQIVGGPAAYADKSHIELAGMVRMLMRDDLYHEGVCTAARDRIVWLADKLGAANDELERIRSDLRTVCRVHLREPENPSEEAFVVQAYAMPDPVNGVSDHEYIEALRRLRAAGFPVVSKPEGCADGQ